MSWGFGNTAGVKQIASYAQAKERYDNIRPIRGRKDDVRPLGSHRGYTDRIMKKNWKVVEDGYVGKWQVTYSANVWSTDRIEWFPDGKLFVGTGGYSNPTINSTINYTLCDNYGQMHSYNGKQYFRTLNGKGYLMTAQGVMLEPTGEEIQMPRNIIGKIMQPTNPIQEFKYSVNRKALNKVRNRFKEFLIYGTNMFLIDEKVEITKEELQKFFGESRPNSFGYATWAKDACKKNRAHLLEEVNKFLFLGDLELAYNLARYVGRSAGGWYDRCTADQFKKHFIEILKFEFNDEIFNATPVPIGTMFYDANFKYYK